MQEDVEVLFVAARGRAKNDALKLRKRRFRLNIKKEFVLRAVQQWNSLFQIVQCLLQVCKQDRMSAMTYTVLSNSYFQLFSVSEIWCSIKMLSFILVTFIWL